MQRVVSSEEMRLCDETTISSFGIPGLLLMERAGVAASDRILRRFGPTHQSAIVVCGGGNNGGDGFVIARTLSQNGFRVRVVLTIAAPALRGDAAKQFSILRAVARSTPGLAISSSSAIRSLHPGRDQLIVDALFGTGFRGKPRGTAARAIGWMNSAPGPVVSVDIPSGIDGSDGTAHGEAVHADVTITFGLIKTGLLLNEGRENAGEVECLDIGIPVSVATNKTLKTFLVDRPDVASILPHRPKRLHKYTAGKVLIVAGSTGYTGAAALAAKSALRSGSGAVMLLTPGSVYPILARKLTEEIVRPTRDSASGTFGSESVRDVSAHLSWADVLLVGPGISVSPETGEFLSELLSLWDGPTVLDADALTLLSRSNRLLSRMKRSDWILTPHVGEFARLANMEGRKIEHERVESSRSFARQHSCTLVLKGAPTCVASSGGECFLNSTGNPGMATVGSGDVLAGLVAGLRAQGLRSEQASFAGTYLHGRAGDLARDILGERSLLAGDLLQYLPVAMQECSR